MKNYRSRLVLMLSVLFGTTSFSQNIGINTLNPQAALDINGDVIYRVAEMTIADTVTTALDVNTEKFSSYRITEADSAFILAGITSAMDGRVITLINQTGEPMTLHHMDTLAEDENQIVTGNHEDLVLEDMGTVSMQYDTALMKWIVNNSSQVPAGATVWDTTEAGIYIEEFVGIGTDSPVAPLTIMTDLDEPGFTHTAGPDSITVASSISELLGAVGTTTNNMFTLKSNNQGVLHMTPSGNVILGTTAQASQFVGPASSRMIVEDSKFTAFTDLNETGFLQIGGNNEIKIEQGFSYAPFQNFGFIGTTTDHAFRVRAGLYNEGIAHFYPTGQVVIGNVLDPANGKLAVYSGADGLGFIHKGTVGSDPPVLRTHCGASSASIGTVGNHNFRLVTGNTTRLGIRYDGAIGINTENPVELLTIYSDNTLETSGFSHRNLWGIVVSSHLGQQNASFGTRTNNGFRLVTNNLTRIHINPDGKVGVGTENPLNLFEVKGTMRAQELIIETTNWPDYVFADDYQLKPLSEIENFIQENNHLPNIQSAAEMESNGVHVGDTQKKMMEKIEELTLYIIELNKRIQQLENAK